MKQWNTLSANFVNLTKHNSTTSMGQQGALCHHTQQEFVNTQPMTQLHIISFCTSKNMEQAILANSSLFR